MKYFARIIDGAVKVFGAGGSTKIEPIPVEEFVRRSGANNVAWRATRHGALLVTDVDQYGVTIMRTRFQLR